MGSLVEPVKIDGLRDLQRALKQLDGESQKQLRVVFNQAAETVIGGAARRVPRSSGRARASLRAKSGQREAIAVGGGRKAPYYPWLDFGGRTGIKRSVERRFLPSGRYLYPSWEANRSTVLDGMVKAIGDMARNAGLEVT